MESTAALALALLGRRRWSRRRRGRRAGAMAALRLVAGLYLIVLAALLAATLLPLVVGWRPYLITSGSMNPEVPAGSVVLADRDGPLPVGVGALVVVHDPARPGTLLAHRVVAVHADGSLVTKGDANAAADPAPVPPTAVIGRVQAVVPLLGRLAQHRTPALVLALLAGLLLTGPRRRRTGRLPRALVATTVVAALISALTWQATAATLRGPAGVQRQPSSGVTCVSSASRTCAQ